MVERRDKTTTEGRGLGHSWADDNVERGDPDVDFQKRRPRFPFGDDPRGREIDFEDTSGRESYGSTRNQVFRAYRGKAPLEGQEFGAPARRASLDTISDLRAAPPNRTTDDTANAALQAGQRAVLESTNFAALFPSVTISSPSPGATFSPGDEVTVSAPASALRSLFSATLEVDGQATDRRVLDRRDQDSTPEFTFQFIYQIPHSRSLGPMDITVRVFNAATAFKGTVGDDAPVAGSIKTGLGTLDGRPGSATSSADYQKLLDNTGILRTPEGVSSITINIV